MMHKESSELKWYLQMGVDEAIEETPVNRFNKIKNTAAESSVPDESLPAESISRMLPVTESGRYGKPMSDPSSATLDTRKAADKCRNLNELREAVYNFKSLSIARTATNTVFADGNPDSGIMLIGEAPGAEEDAQGIPFCGASGQLLDQMLSRINLTRQKNFYITNTIFWRPPGNRRPTPEELAICLPFVEKHIAIIKPALIILVGGTAITSLLASKDGITKMRGNFFDYGNCYIDGVIKTTAIFHPSYLLRSPGQKRVAWHDLLMIEEWIKNA